MFKIIIHIYIDMYVPVVNFIMFRSTFYPIDQLVRNRRHTHIEMLLL